MEIRAFQMADYEAVIALWGNAGLLPSRSDEWAEIAKKLERDPELFLIGLESGLVVGAVLGGYDGRRGWIYHLAVSPEQQAKGFGVLLLEELESRLRQKGCLKVNLLIETDNAGVQAFYRRRGYECDQLVFMEKWLA